MDNVIGDKGQPTMFSSYENSKSLDAIVISLRSRRHPIPSPVKKSKKKVTKTTE